MKPCRLSWRMIEAIDLMVEDIKTLSKAAVEGNLSSRVDACKLPGKYRNVVQGVNKTLDAVIAPVLETGRVLRKIAPGDLTAHVEGNYLGDHARMKNDINPMATTLTQHGSDCGACAGTGQLLRGTVRRKLPDEFQRRRDFEPGERGVGSE